MIEQKNGKNADGSDHILYLLDGFSSTILEALSDITAGDYVFPLTIEINGTQYYFAKSWDLMHFTMGMQVAFGLCSL